MPSTEGTFARLRDVWRRRTARPLDETTAWACLVANLLLWPGLGGAALRETDGFLQMLLSFAAGVVAIVSGVRIIAGALGGGDPDTLWPLLRAMTLGLGAFALVWLWALVSSLRLVRESKTR